MPRVQMQRVDSRGVDYDIILVRRVANVTQPTEGVVTIYRD